MRRLTLHQYVHKYIKGTERLRARRILWASPCCREGHFSTVPHVHAISKLVPGIDCVGSPFVSWRGGSALLCSSQNPRFTSTERESYLVSYLASYPVSYLACYLVSYPVSYLTI